MVQLADISPLPGHARALRVAWVAGPGTLRRYGRMLQTVVIGLMDELTEVLALCPPETEPSALPCPPAQMLTYRPGRWCRGRRCLAAAQELVRRDIHMLHCLEPSALDVTRRIARAANIPFVVSCYSTAQAPILRDQHERGLLAASQGIYDRLAAHAGLGPRTVHLVRPGVFRVGRPTCFEDPSHSAAIVAGGPLTDAAPFEAVLRAFRALLDRGHDCAFFLVGNGPAEHALRKRAEHLGLLGDLTFADQMDSAQLAGLFKAADLYVSPCRDAELDFSSLLALGAGIPVVSAGGDADDFLQDGQTAVFFRPGDADDLAAKLAGLLDDHEKAKGLAGRAVGVLEAYHSPAAMVGQLAGIYRQIVSGWETAAGVMAG